MIRPPVIGFLYFVILYEGGISLTLKRNEKVHKKDLKKVEVWFTMELSGEKW